jgi:hypothetical protein
MAGLLDGIMEQLGAGGVAQISQALGADEGSVGSAVAAALPAILGGLANNSQNPSGAAALANALDNHSPSIFDQLGSLLTSGGGDGAKILGHVLGSRQPQVEQHLAQQSGLDLSMITKLLPLLAPLVMGYLSKQKQSRQLDPSSLGQVLGQERSQQETALPGLGGLAAILDANHDGSVIDDVLGKLTGH